MHIRICTKHTKHSCLLKPPMEEHSVLGWGEVFFGERRGLTESRSDFLQCCFAVRFVMKPVWLAAIGSLEGVLLFGKRLWIFWQNHLQLQGQNVVFLSEAVRKFDVMEIWSVGRKPVTPVLGDKNTSLFILREQVMNFGRRGVRSSLEESICNTSPGGHSEL